MGAWDDFTGAVDDAWQAVSDVGKDIGVSTLTDPVMRAGGALVSSDVGTFLARVWATNGYNFFVSPQAFLVLGPAAPALATIMLAAPSLAKGETSFARAYAEQAIWALNTGAAIMQVQGITLPAVDLAQAADLDSRLVKEGAERLREMRAYGVDVEQLSRDELVRIVGTDRVDLALLARAAATETLRDVEASRTETDRLARDVQAMNDAHAQASDAGAQRRARVAAGQALIDRAERVAAGQALIDRADVATQWDTAGAPRNRTAENIMLAGVIAAAIGALVWWSRGQKTHG